MSDLHWLVHEGHVIEFANGILETAKKPAPKPVKPPGPPEAKPASSPGDVAKPSATDDVPPAEASSAPLDAVGETLAAEIPAKGQAPELSPTDSTVIESPTADPPADDQLPSPTVT
jgi:hypothetical protein